VQSSSCGAVDATAGDDLDRALDSCWLYVHDRPPFAATFRVTVQSRPVEARGSSSKTLNFVWPSTSHDPSRNCRSRLRSSPSIPCAFPPMEPRPPTPTVTSMTGDSTRREPTRRKRTGGSA
jgi:hypothetical protein